MGVTYLGSNLGLTDHDWAAAWISGGRVRAVSLERLARVKKFPADASAQVSKAACRGALAGYARRDPGFAVGTVVAADAWAVGDAGWELGVPTEKKEVPGHHFLHACSAFYPSPFPRAAVLCVDGNGFDPELGAVTQSFWAAEGTAAPKALWHDRYDPAAGRVGLGWAYQLHAELCGMGEGSLMGLAAYGDPKVHAGKSVLVDLPDGSVTLKPQLLAGFTPGASGDFLFHPGVQARLVEFWGLDPRRVPEMRKAPHESPLAHVAARLQQETQDALVRLALRLHALFPETRLCLAGGVALNCLANSDVAARTPFKEIFVQPAATDDGLALGAAYWAYHAAEPGSPRIPLADPGLGVPYAPRETLEALKGFRDEVSVTPAPDAPASCAADIASGSVVAWFRGGAEFGARALGRRSLLCLAHDPALRDALNARKGRAAWRPVAPALLTADARKFFPGPDSFHMTMASPASAGAQELLPSGVHVDGTARVQTVDAARDPDLARVVAETSKITGRPAVLNTSMNVGGEPIVETPAQAVELLLSGAADVLYLGDLRVAPKPGARRARFDPKAARNAALERFGHGR